MASLLSHSAAATNDSLYEGNAAADRYSRLHHMLHAAFDIENLMDVFYYEAQQLVHFDSVTFDNRHFDCHYQAGVHCRHSAHYRLFANEDFVGDLRFTRATPFDEGELNIIESLLTSLTLPIQDSLAYRDTLEA